MLSVEVYVPPELITTTPSTKFIFDLSNTDPLTSVCAHNGDE